VRLSFAIARSRESRLIGRKRGVDVKSADAAPNLSRPAIYTMGGLIALSAGALLFASFWELQRIWANLLVASYGLLGFGLGGALLLALFFVTGARWSDGIRPVAEKLTLLLPAGAVGVLVVLALAPSFYSWNQPSDDPRSPLQALWLSPTFLILRAAIYLALWLGLTLLLVRASRQAAQHRDSSRGKCVRISAIFLVVFAVTFWLASVDWIMSLEPRWSSTIFGLYNFSGMFLAALAAVIVLAAWFDRRGLLERRVTVDQWRDLGTLLFGFSSFWMYIWFSQYLLIWYVNNPEEAEYYVARQQPHWQSLLIANLVLNWAVPFVVLLFRPAKENPYVLLAVAGTILVGRWLDLYLMVLPPVAGRGAAFGIWDACLIPGTVGLAVLLLAMRAPRRAVGLVPVGQTAETIPTTR
jgi:hypothetical protein